MKTKKINLAISLVVVSTILLIFCLRPFVPAFFSMSLPWKIIYIILYFGYPLLMIAPAVVIASILASIPYKNRPFQRQEQVSVVTFHTSFDFERTKKRYEICRDIFLKNAASVTDIHAKGHSRLEQFFYLIHIGDWISCYIADLKGIDAVEVNVINDLKNALAKY